MQDKSADKQGIEQAVAGHCSWQITDDFPCDFPVGTGEIAIILRELSSELLGKFYGTDPRVMIIAETQEDRSK